MIDESIKDIEGRKFIHAFWLDDLRTATPTECIVTDVSEDAKVITFLPINPKDRRRGQCKTREFWSIFRKWSDGK